MDRTEFMLNPRFHNCDGKIFDNTAIIVEQNKLYTDIYKNGLMPYQNKQSLNPEPVKGPCEKNIKNMVMPNTDIGDNFNQESKILHDIGVVDFCHPREKSINRFEPLFRDIQHPSRSIFAMHRFGAPTNMVGRSCYGRF